MGLNIKNPETQRLARCMREPLLFKGDDFGHTDVEPALSQK